MSKYKILLSVPIKPFDDVVLSQQSFWKPLPERFNVELLTSQRLVRLYVNKKRQNVFVTLFAGK